MKKSHAIGLGLLTGAALAAAVLLLLSLLLGEPESAPAGPASEVPVHLREEAEPPAGASIVRSQPVTIYQRAQTAELRLAAVPGQIIWFPAPVERARQIVRLVLEGPGEAGGALRPTSAAVRYREVYIDVDGVAWVDLEAKGVEDLRGSDEEQALVAAVARSLVEGLDEVRAVGFLVGGEGRRTLAGHVDLSRTYDGSEWLLVGERAPDRDPVRGPSLAAEPQPGGELS